MITEDVSGNRLTRAPEFQAFATAKYEREFGSLTASLSATYRRQSSVFFLETNQDTPTFRNSGWHEIDLSATISRQDSHWELALYAKNLTDNRHITAVTALGGFPNASINAPRRWGVEGTLRF
ncbi:MAG: TonB-dependent receptor [Parvularculaceae bacterium]